MNNCKYIAKRLAASILAVIMLTSLSVNAAWDGYKEEEISELDLVNMNSIADIAKIGASASCKHVRSGKLYSIGWEDMNSLDTLYLRDVPKDWSGIDMIEMQIYSEEVSPDNMIAVIVESPDNPDGTINYHYTQITLDWQGWKRIVIPVSELITIRNGDLKNVEYVRITSTGWSMNPEGCDNKIYIGELKIKSAIDSLERLYDPDDITEVKNALSDGIAIYKDSPNVATQAEDVKKLNGTDDSLCPYMVRNTLMTPLCLFDNYLQAETQVDGDNIIISYEDKTIECDKNTNKYKINGIEYELSVAPTVIDSTVYVPAAEVAKLLGYNAISDRGLVVIGMNDDIKIFNRPYGVNEYTEIVSYLAGHVSVDIDMLTDEDCKAVKDKWRYRIVGSESDNDMNNEQISQKIKAIETEGSAMWANMIQEPEQKELFKGDNTTSTADMTSAFGKLYRMALAYGTYGSGLYKNEELKEAIKYGIDWLYNNRYGEDEKNGVGWRDTSAYNWWDWQIGSPKSLIPTLLIMEDEYTKKEITKYLTLFDALVPSIVGDGSNALNTAELAIGSALLQNNYKKVFKIQSGIENVYLYVDNGRNDAMGFYTDGSYVFHIKHPMNGTYGLEQFQLLGPFVNMFKGTKFEITTPQVDNVSEWIENGFEPLIYNGAVFRMVKGRYPTGQHTTGKDALGAMIDVLDCLEEEQKNEVKAAIKAQVQTDTSINYYTALSLSQVLKLTQIMSDDSINARESYKVNHVYHNMDKVVHQRDNFALGLSMSSSRIFNYESINGCNLTGWYISDGMTEYYTDGDKTQATDNYWNYVNPYRLPGTTVDSQEREAASIIDYEAYLSSKDFVGAVNMNGEYGTAAMWLESYHNAKSSGVEDVGYGGAAPVHKCDLEAKKSYFMFDDEVVCLGADIHSTDNSEVVTVVDNKLSTTTKRMGEGVETESYPIISAKASDNPEADNIDANTIDGNYRTKWASENGSTLVWDIGEEKELGFIALAFQFGDQRSQKFKLETSSDGKKWNKVFDGESSGTTEMDEAFTLGNTKGRYIRFTNYGSSIGTWVSLTEAKIYAPNPDGSMQVSKADIIGADKFVSDDIEYALTDETQALENAKWVNFEHVGGYYFPNGGRLHAKYTKGLSSFMELWLSHGENPTDEKYEYVLLPGKNVDETKTYAGNPDIEVLSNTKTIQAVKEKNLNITGYVFWEAGKFDDITVDQPLIVMSKEQNGKFYISVCDPTHKLEKAAITINKKLTPVSVDTAMSVSGSGGNTTIALDLKGAAGRTAEAEFNVVK